jgi:succinylglutamic semialdehyde dehydrogenase
MANGHIMPALIAGNSVVFKPSELTSLCGMAVAQLWSEAGLPPGVMSCVTGGSDVGSMLIQSRDVDGVFFVGSHSAGMSILESTAANPEKIVAVEMGGNSPLLIEDFDEKDLRSVLSVIIHSAFISSGQRCSAARRLLINNKHADLAIQIASVLPKVRIGHYKEDPEPFYGPMIRPGTARRALEFAQKLEEGGAVYLQRPTLSGPYGTMLSPGLIDVSQCTSKIDEELFGPILQLEFYDTFEAGIRAAASTKFGLAAGIVTREYEKYHTFSSRVKAGIINWNQQLTGATTFAPFGGVKHSGNYRPAGYLSADYCSYATASFEVEADSIPAVNTPGLSVLNS